MPQANLNWIILLPFLAGVAVVIQTALNGQLRVLVNSPLLAALLSFIIGTVALVILVVVTKQQVPQISHLSGSD